jgi:hypothetical protein
MKYSTGFEVVFRKYANVYNSSPYCILKSKTLLGISYDRCYYFQTVFQLENSRRYADEFIFIGIKYSEKKKKLISVVLELKKNQ